MAPLDGWRLCPRCATELSSDDKQASCPSTGYGASCSMVPPQRAAADCAFRWVARFLSSLSA